MPVSLDMRWFMKRIRRTLLVRMELSFSEKSRGTELITGTLVTVHPVSLPVLGVYHFDLRPETKDSVWRRLTVSIRPEEWAEIIHRECDSWRLDWKTNQDEYFTYFPGPRSLTVDLDKRNILVLQGLARLDCMLTYERKLFEQDHERAVLGTMQHRVRGMIAKSNADWAQLMKLT